MFEIETRGQALEISIDPSPKSLRLGATCTLDHGVVMYAVDGCCSLCIGRLRGCGTVARSIRRAAGCTGAETSAEVIVHMIYLTSTVHLNDKALRLYSRRRHLYAWCCCDCQGSIGRCQCDPCPACETSRWHFWHVIST